MIGNGKWQCEMRIIAMLVRKNENEISKEGGNGYLGGDDVASSEDIGMNLDNPI